MKQVSADKVFRALSEPSRRKMLDLVKANPGITVGALSDAFDVTRYAVMKHLRVLEDAEIIVPRRNGKTKELYLNAIPIQTIYDRWISRYSARWASQLTGLKYQLEQEELPMANHQQLYVLYIRTTADKLWQALTDPAQTVQYFHKTEIVSNFQVGSAIDYMVDGEGGKKRSAVTGKIVSVEPRKRLGYTFKFPGNEDPPSTVTYELEPQGDVTKLTVTHDFPEANDTFKGTSQGWPKILNALKTLLETGEPLPIDFDH
jgi:uncharacterized protein YndB with AHSA1/START domain